MQLFAKFIDKADTKTKEEIKCLIAGECIEKEINQELTYPELDDKTDNLWSVLFTTGYLTQRERLLTWYLVVYNNAIFGNTICK